jgi:hypothetical protein
VTIPSKKQILSVIEAALRDNFPDAHLQVGLEGLIVAESAVELYRGHTVAVGSAANLLNAKQRAAKKI